MSSNRGDTLIEVMLVIAILAIVVLSVFGVMGRGTAQLQLASERSQVRTELDGQINALRALRDEYIAMPSAGSPWGELLADKVVTGTPQFDGSSCSAVSSDPFYVQIDEVAGTISIQSYINPMPGGIAKPGDGIWVEAYERKGTANPVGIDLLFRACWPAMGNAGLQHETSLVRLHDGR